MHRFLSPSWLALPMLLTMAASQSLSPTNFTSKTHSLQTNNTIQLYFGTNLMGSLLPLTTVATQLPPQTPLQGLAVLGTTNNFSSLNDTQIAFIPCDYINNSEIEPQDIFNGAVLDTVDAVVLYSTQADYCALSGYGGALQWIFSLTNATVAKTVESDIKSMPTLFATVTSSGSAPSSTADSHGPPSPPSTAAAMIILYAITGVVAGLFLAIIVTGAVRAHRHPERYGPRNIIGRARQSRAKGLARAMLETLPIVKFGEQEGTDPKTTDVELGESRSDSTHGEEEIPNEQDAQTNKRATDDGNDEVGSSRPAHDHHTTESGIAPAIDAQPPAQPTKTGNPGHVECAICAEEFEAGQDQRVLPCDHRFHPACIDPWLLNISGTCPLCRIDLRPQEEDEEEEQELDEDGNPIPRGDQAGDDMPPPLATTGSQGERRRLGVRRSIMLSLMGFRRPDSVNSMTRDERVRALRQLRQQESARRQRERDAAAEQTIEEETSDRSRLRNLLYRRTRGTGVAADSAPPASAPAPAPTPTPPQNPSTAS